MPEAYYQKHNITVFEGLCRHEAGYADDGEEGDFVCGSVGLL